MIKKYFSKIATTLVLIGGILTLGGCGSFNHNGNIDLSDDPGSPRVVDVHYNEGIPCFYQDADDLNMNRMIIKEGDTLYKLLDMLNERSITAHNYECQELERIVIKEKGQEEKTYTINDKKGDSLKVHHARRVFDRCNALYNKARSKLRDKVKEQHSDLESSIPQ